MPRSPISITVKGLEQLKEKMGAFEKGLPAAMEKTTKEVIIFVHSNIPDYPPKPAGSTYTRTLTLWRTLTSFMGAVPDALSRVEKAFGELRGWIGTKLNYAPYVIDEENQTAVHRAHGWWRLQEVVLGLQDGIRNVYEKGVSRYVRSIFK